MPSVIMLRRVLWYAKGNFNLTCTVIRQSIVGSEKVPVPFL